MLPHKNSWKWDRQLLLSLPINLVFILYWIPESQLSNGNKPPQLYRLGMAARPLRNACPTLTWKPEAQLKRREDTKPRNRFQGIIYCGSLGGKSIFCNSAIPAQVGLAPTFTPAKNSPARRESFKELHITPPRCVQTPENKDLHNKKDRFAFRF